MKWDYRFTFGKYRAQRVDEVAKTMYGKSYIAWAYYNKEDLDFSDDIIEALGLEKIAKPGAQPELYGKWMDEHSSEMEGISAYVEHVKMGKASSQRAYYKRAQKAVYVRTQSRDLNENSRARLTWVNQGHN